MNWIKRLLLFWIFPAKNGIRKRFFKCLIPLMLPGYHLAGNPIGSGRKKKVKEVEGDANPG